MREEKKEGCNNEEEKGGDNKKEREGQATKRTRGRRNWVGGGREVVGAQGDSTRRGVQPHDGGEEEKGGEWDVKKKKRVTARSRHYQRAVVCEEATCGRLRATTCKEATHRLPKGHLCHEGK